MQRIAGLRAADEQLGDEPVVGDRCLVVAAVAAYLVLHLGDQLAARPAPPRLALAPAREERRDDEQADDVGEVVVGPRPRRLQVASG